jgi:hypothetical protein
MNSILSVKKAEKPPNRVADFIFVIVIALICILAKIIWSNIPVIVLLIFLGVGFLVFAFDEPSYSVKIEGTTGKVTALESSDENYIQDIVQAMNEAIMKRR